MKFKNIPKWNKWEGEYYDAGDGYRCKECDDRVEVGVEHVCRGPSTKCKECSNFYWPKS